MGDLHLTMAIGDYDQTRDLALGRVRATGLDLTILNLPVEEIFYRFYDRLEWQISELSMGMYSSARSHGDDRFVALPVFPSRVFRHASIYVHAGGGIAKPEDLAGKRIGVPQWSQTAGIYARGFLSATVGLPLGRMFWIQAGVNDPGRVEPAKLHLPPEIELRVVADRSLNEMLLAGDLDAVISARPPLAFTQKDSRVRQLFPDYRAAEAAYFAATGIFPIMHTVVIRRETYEADRWIARNLYLAFSEAKERSLRRMLDAAVSVVPLPWVSDLAQAAQQMFPAGDLWPYGIEPNRRTLEAFLRFAYEQGVCHRLLRPEEIFAEEATAEIKV